MSIVTHIFLDTSIFDGQQYNFSSATLASFVGAADDLGVWLVLPDPTEREVRRHISDRSRDAMRALNEAYRKAPFLSKWRHFQNRLSNRDELLEVTRIALSEWADFVGQLKVIRLGYDRIDMPMIMDWYDKASAPFGTGKKRKEFPDAFAIAMLASYAKSEGIRIGVVSLDPDFKAACENFSSLVYFESLPHLTESLLSNPSRVLAIKAAIVADLEKLESRLLAYPFSFYYFDDNFELEDSRVSRVAILGIAIVAAVDDDVWTLTFEATVESEHVVHLQEWFDPEYARYDEEEYEVRDEAAITGSAKVALVKGDISGIRAIVSFDVDEPEIRITCPVDA